MKPNLLWIAALWACLSACGGSPAKDFQSACKSSEPDALRKSALETDIPEGGTMLGFGVKFFGEGTPMAGQNERSFPVVIQYIDDKSYVVWPKSQAQREAVLPLPKGTTFSSQ